MATAQAAVLRAFNQPLATESFPLPDRLEPGALLVRTEMAGVCGTDVHLWKGELPIALPIILGHETVGRIEAIGGASLKDWTGKPLHVGDRITWNSTLSCGHCPCCTDWAIPTRCPERRAYGIGYRCDEPPHFLGGFAEYHYLRPGATTFRLPDTLPNESVIGAGCALVTSVHGLERVCGQAESGTVEQRCAPAQLPPRHRRHVIVQGAGPVGIAALVMARLAGAEKILVIGGPAQRLELAGNFGTDATLDLEEVPEPARRREWVMEWSEGRGADVVLECVGHPPAFVEAVDLCRDGARLLVLGHYCDAGPIAFNPHGITRKQLEIHGSWSSEPRHMKAALDILERMPDRFPFGDLVTHRFSLDHAQEALETTAAWRSAKSVITP